MWAFLLGPAISAVGSVIRGRTGMNKKWMPLVNAGLQLGGAAAAAWAGGLPVGGAAMDGLPALIEAAGAVAAVGGANAVAGQASYEAWKRLKRRRKRRR